MNLIKVLYIIQDEYPRDTNLGENDYSFLRIYVNKFNVWRVVHCSRWVLYMGIPTQDKMTTHL